RRAMRCAERPHAPRSVNRPAPIAKKSWRRTARFGTPGPSGSLRRPSPRQPGPPTTPPPRSFARRRTTMVVWDAENAAHLVSRAGFGGDTRDVEKYVRYGQVTAVEKLVTVKGTGAKGPGKSGNAAQNPDDLRALKTWWAKRMVKATSRRLQEKMCLFWHDHFACSASMVKNNLWMAKQNALFRRYGLGAFKTL